MAPPGWHRRPTTAGSRTGACPSFATSHHTRRPYDCLFGCNFAIRRETLGELRFREAYDGHWGYEDIDLGYRLHRRGAPFRYVPEAFVYHQEGGELTEDDRQAGRSRNFPILAATVPGFADYRAGASRP